MEVLGFAEALVGSIFLAAGLAKTAGSRSIAPFLTAVGIRPGGATMLARAVPVSEIAVGGMLVAGVGGTLAASAAALPAVAFVAVQLRAYRRNAPGCECFGALDASTPPEVALVRASALAGGTAALVVAHLAAGSAALVYARPGSSTVAALACGLAFVLGFALVGTVAGFERWRPRPVRPPRLEAR